MAVGIAECRCFVEFDSCRVALVEGSGDAVARKCVAVQVDSGEQEGVGIIGLCVCRCWKQCPCSAVVRAPAYGVGVVV